MITPFVRAAKISSCGRYRFTLVRVWDEGPRVMYIGHNPSKADGTVDDPTCQKMMTISDSWGFGSMIVVNLIPFRSALPGDAHAWYARAQFLDRFEDAMAMLDNAAAMIDNLPDCSKVVACWGGIAAPVKNLQDDMRDYFRRHDQFLEIFGCTQNGFPIHPLARGRNRIPDTATTTVWSPE